MTPLFQSRDSQPAAYMQMTHWRAAFLLVLVGFLSLATSCSSEDNAVVNEPLLKGVISSYNLYDGAFLDFTKEDMANAGFALGDVLCGATYNEIVADYLVTYDNYYRVNMNNSPETCAALVTLKLNPCLMHYANVDDETQLPNVDYAQAFSAYLLSHGMSQQQLDALVQALTANP